MNTGSTLFPIILFLNALFLAGIATYIFSRKSLPGARYFSILIFFVAWWSLLGSHEMTLYGASNKILANQLLYIGKTFVGVYWFLFTLEFAGGAKSEIKKWQGWLFLIPLIIVALIGTDSIFHWFWLQTVPVDASNPLSPVTYVPNWGFILNVVYQYTFMALGALVLIIHVIRVKEPHVIKQCIFTLIAAIIPWCLNLFYVVFSQQYNGYEFTPIAFILTGLFVSISIFHYRFFDATMAAQELVYNKVGHGVVVVDMAGRIIEANDVALAMFRDELRVGFNLNSEIYPNGVIASLAFALNGKKKIFFYEPTNNWYRVEVVPAREKPWKLVFIHEYSQLHDRFTEIQEKQLFLKSVVDFLDDAVFVLDTSEEIIVWNKAMEHLSQINRSTTIGNPIPAALSFIDMTKPQGKFKHNDNYYAYEKKPLLNDNENLGTIVYIRDISDTKQAGVQLEKRVATLEKIHTIMKQRDRQSVKSEKSTPKKRSNVAAPWHKT